MPFELLENIATPAGAGTNVYSQDIDGGTLYLATIKAPNGADLAAGLTFVPEDGSGDTPLASLSTNLNQTTGSLPQGAITGSGNVVLISTNALPGAQLVRTAAQMLADMPGGHVGQEWRFRICNSGAGTLTLTADAGPTVTLSGTMTVATNTYRDFIAKFTSATAATITNVGLGAYT